MKVKKTILIVFLIIGFILPVLASPKGHYFYEKDYQKHWCDASGGITEHILPDRARVDCLTSTHAIEFDFARKWPEAIGQSLYYAQSTGKKAGIVLILENPEKDQKYLNRIISIAKIHKITIWTMTPDDMPRSDIALK